MPQSDFGPKQLLVVFPKHAASLGLEGVVLVVRDFRAAGGAAPLSSISLSRKLAHFLICLCTCLQ